MTKLLKVLFLQINESRLHDSIRIFFLERYLLLMRSLLQVCRDFALTRDETELRVHWPHVLSLMRGALRWDKDGDGLIENGGTADQTYDTWIMTGPRSVSPLLRF